MDRRLITSGVLAVAVLALAAMYWMDVFMSPDSWETELPEVGSSSSPRAVELTGDGVLDVVMGAGGDEYASTSYGVFALDGHDGSLLWSVPARDQVVGTPVFKDITGDDTPDVFIGGRSAVLYAINGKSGERIWEFLPTHDSLDIVSDRSILNFYNPQFIPDQDGDGIDDLLVAYGGYTRAPPGQTDRPAGALLVISSKDGRTLSRAEVPDGKETYMSPIVHDFGGNGQLSLLFGTGGETIGGHLYRAPLSRVLKGDVSGIDPIAAATEKGFVAPPVLADVTGDGVKDIVVNAVEGRVLCFDGATNELLWTVDLGDEYEGYSTPAPGHFDEDDELDFFVSYGYGTWPNMDFTVQLVIDGKKGSIAFRDTIGTFQYASPLTFDFTEDGRDDVLIAVNELEVGGPPVGRYVNELRVLDPHTGKDYRFKERRPGSNLGSTPLLTDLDGDGYLDVIYCYMETPGSFFSFSSATIERIETTIPIEGTPSWGSYMGPEAGGVFRE